MLDLANAKEMDRLASLSELYDIIMIKKKNDDNRWLFPLVLNVFSLHPGIFSQLEVL